MNRGTEIFTVLSRYGLADWIHQLNLDFAKGILKANDGELLSKYSREARIRMAISDLGPTFIKLGQILSTRPDIVGVELADELKKLQADVPADSFDAVKKTLESELCQPIESIFARFDVEPIASASIGQVHLAELLNGKTVVVKVQHAAIEKKVNEDLDILAGFAALAERLPEFAPYRPTTTVAEFQRALRRELDYGREERNMLQFAAQFSDDETVLIPAVYSEYCTSRVLTMEYIEGVKLSQREALEEMEVNFAEVARRGAELYVSMIFDHGFYHADPHPGNILVLPGDVIGLLDFGMVGRIDDRLREEMEDLLVGLTSGDADMLSSVIMRWGTLPKELDDNSLRREISDFIGDYAHRPLEKMNFGEVINDMFRIIRSYQIALPPQVAMLLKTMVMLDGTGRLLDPEFNLVQLLQRHRRRIMMKRFSPKRRWRKWTRFYREMERLAEVAPRRMSEMLEQVRTGRFDVHLDHRMLGPTVNRLVTGIVASSLFLGSALMLSMKVPPLLFHHRTPVVRPLEETSDSEQTPPAQTQYTDDTSYMGMRDISIMGMSGLIISFGISLRLLLAINKSGHLDRPE
ncbi:ABC transporter [Blastopirellula marina DSM 3645]|uniref:ABC transporter n=2 Tax=Blastopirellula marina TaxID=124 RepID=A3ZUP3_9BACT|nr:ABC transporter [Blastopirellula marina DSM 3645]